MISSLNDNQAANYLSETYGSHPYQGKRGISGQDDRGNPSLPSDNVGISEKARELQEVEKDEKIGISDEKGLTTEEKEDVEELKRRDKQVKAHEMAHVAAGAGLVRGGASYEYEVGPDGKRYAVEGEVSIDTAPETEPVATIAKMQRIKRAALAPSEPSGTDRAVATQASRTEAKARAELLEEKTREVKEEKEEKEGEGKSSTENEMTVHESPPTTPEVGTKIDVVI